ncbi:MAG: hypothetical protein ACKOAL_10495 [Chthoniobacterales bacterium]
MGHGRNFGRRIGGEEIAVCFQRAFHVALLRARGCFVDHRQSEQRTFGIELGCFLEKLRCFFRVAHRSVGVGEIHVAHGHREVRGDRVALVRALEFLVFTVGLGVRVLQRVGHGDVVEVALLLLVLGQERTGMAEDDARFVVFALLEIGFAHFLHGRHGLVGTSLQLGQFAAVALRLHGQTFLFRFVPCQCCLPY